MAEPFLGQLMCVGFSFNPRGWMNCDGQILQISQYTALFSLFGTMYGGDGRTTFGVPGLRGRVPIHVGTGPGLSPRKQGEKGGTETVTLNTQQIPSHTHAFTLESHKLRATTNAGNTDDPTDKMLAKSAGSYAAGSGATVVDMQGPSLQLTATNGNTGGSQAHNNMQPFQVLRWIVATTGIYPSRS